MALALSQRQNAPVLLVLLAAVLTVMAMRPRARAVAPKPVDLLIDVPPIPGDVARPLAFGFRALLADFTFIEAIQVLAQRRAGATWAEDVPFDRRLQRLLEYSVEVDPKFAGAYRFAGFGLPHETVDGKVGGVLAAVQILEQGIRERPDDWRIGLCLGFLQSYYLRDYAAAAVTMATAAKAQGAPRYVSLLATRLAAQGGVLQMATEIAERMLQEANEEETRKEWEKRVRDLHMEHDLRLLEEAVQRYRATHGNHPPRSLQELAGEPGLGPGIPAEPHGGTYTLDAEGNVKSTASDRLRVYGAYTELEVR